MKISFIGNCQTLSLMIYFQSLLNNDEYILRWLRYSEQPVFPNYEKTAIDNFNCNILDDVNGLEFLNESDIVITNVMSEQASPIFNSKNVKLNIKKNCKVIFLNPIYMSFDTEFNECIAELKRREHQNSILYNDDNCEVIKFAEILECYSHLNRTELMRINSNAHPTTFINLLN